MASMKAVTFREFGGPEVLQATEVERPQTGPDDVLVRIHAAGICYHDVLSRAGKIPAQARPHPRPRDRGRDRRVRARTSRPRASASAS